MNLENLRFCGLYCKNLFQCTVQKNVIFFGIGCFFSHLNDQRRSDALVRTYQNFKRLLSIPSFVQIHHRMLKFYDTWPTKQRQQRWGGALDCYVSIKREKQHPVFHYPTTTDTSRPHSKTFKPKCYQHVGCDTVQSGRELPICLADTTTSVPASSEQPIPTDGP